MPHLHSPVPLSHTLPAGHGPACPPHAHAPLVHRSAVVLEQPAEQAAPSIWAQLGKVPWSTQWPVLPSQQPPPESAAHLVEAHSQTSGSGAVLHT